jgi:hypothetical protein
MCDFCDCLSIPVIEELSAEHERLADRVRSGAVRAVRW